MKFAQTSLAVALAICAQLWLPNESPAQQCSSPDNETRVSGGKECLVIRTFRPAGPAPEPTLAIFIHGDLSGGGPADYIYDRANAAVKDGVITVGLLRPGHPDRQLAKEYVASLERRGIKARFVSVPGADHNSVVRSPEASTAIRSLLEGL